MTKTKENNITTEGNNINSWYKTPLGSELLKYELTMLSDFLPELFGYYIAQIGGPAEIDNKNILSATTIHNHIYINPETKSHYSHDILPIKCDITSLPFQSESIDAFVLFHTLEFMKDPKIILNEIHRVLINGGHLIVFSFNPRSLWGIKKFFEKSDTGIWNSNWFSPRKMRKLLAHAGFDTGDYQTVYFRPPTKKMIFMEGLGQIFWSYCGASYMFSSQKATTLLTPVLDFNKQTKTVGKLQESTSSESV